MDKQQVIFIEAAVLLNDIVDEYINYFKFRDERKNEKLIERSTLRDDNIEGLKKALFCVLEVMNWIEYEATSELGEYVARRKKVEQIQSILHIGRSHPDSAIKRLRGLRPKFERA